MEAELIMVETTSRAALPRVRTVWFGQRPSLAACFGLAEYKQCSSDGRHPGFIRQPFHTKIVDLDVAPEQLMAGFQPRTRSFVRQAERQGVTAEIETDRQRFIATYNAFAAGRGLARLGPDHVLSRPDGPTVVTRAMLDGRVLAMRGYIVDRAAGRIRNLVNCTADDPADSEAVRKLAGAAHRYLIHADMLRFRADGIGAYDFGGYAQGTADPKLANINRFKDSFGGRVVAEPNYVSWPLHASLAVRGWLRRLRTRGPARPRPQLPG